MTVRHRIIHWEEGKKAGNINWFLDACFQAGVDVLECKPVRVIGGATTWRLILRGEDHWHLEHQDHDTVWGGSSNNLQERT